MIRYLISRRLLSSSSLGRIPLRISPEIQEALVENKPIVSLESTIITHGLPFPRNIEMAFEAEKTIRDNGAVPATCGFISGKPVVGMTKAETTYLGEQSKVNKVSRRDIGYTMANRLNGGTTIAATMILSHLAGIKVFATGGLGGVHRDGENTLDVSADLTELGRTPVTVVCSGPKSILDIGLTMEYLETQGVFVATYCDDGRSKIEVPGFFCRESGVLSPYSFADFEEAARIIHNSSLMNLNSGNLLCIPPPHESALPSEEINGIIEAAVSKAVTKGIKGKEITPFLLSKIAKETDGRSVSCNIEFVLNNAKSAAKISRELSTLEKDQNGTIDTQFTPASHIIDSKGKSSKFPKTHTFFVGAIALDSMSKIKKEVVMGDSNPAETRSSVGGVAHNIYIAAAYSGLKDGKFVSIVGDDIPSKMLIESFKARNEEVDGILIDKKYASATYSSFHDKDGSLILACADMSIIETNFSEHIIKTLSDAEPKLVVLDCNVSTKVLESVVSHLKQKSPSTKIIIDSTSQPKAKKIAKINHNAFPNNSVSMLCPTTSELSALHEEFQENGYFDDFDNWFPVVDSLGINAAFRDRLSKHKVLNNLLKNGHLQQAFKLIPYIPNIYLKLGDKGVLAISMSTSVDDYRSIPTVSEYRPEALFCSKGNTLEDKSYGVVLQYFPIPEENKNLTIKNVTGAGDSFLGYLVAALSKSDWLRSKVNTIEDEWFKWESIHKAQLASGLTLQSDDAVSESIRSIK